MKKNEKISKVMSTELSTVNENATFSEVRNLLAEGGFHHLPVVSGKKLIGIISYTDVLRLSFGDAFGTDDRAVDATLDHTVKIEDMMVQNPISISSESTVRDAAQKLVDGGFHSLPVVEGDELVGIVTSSDLIKYLIDQY